MTTGLIVKPWIVAVPSFSGGQHTYYARSRGKALADAWRCDAFSHLSFGGFLKIARCYGGIGSERFGEQMTVCGKPAFYVSHNSQYIQFVRPDSDIILNSHPYDVEPPEARRGTPYYQEQPR